MYNLSRLAQGITQFLVALLAQWSYLVQAYYSQTGAALPVALGGANTRVASRIVPHKRYMPKKHIVCDIYDDSIVYLGGANNRYYGMLYSTAC